MNYINYKSTVKTVMYRMMQKVTISESKNCVDAAVTLPFIGTVKACSRICRVDLKTMTSAIL